MKDITSYCFKVKVNHNALDKIKIINSREFVIVFVNAQIKTDQNQQCFEARPQRGDIN